MPKEKTHRQKNARSPSELDSACDRAAQKYPEGIAALARRHGFNAHRFQDKLDPLEPVCINPREFEAIPKATKDRASSMHGRHDARSQQLVIREASS